LPVKRVDLAPMQEQLAPAPRLVVARVSEHVHADVHLMQPCLTVATSANASIRVTLPSRIDLTSDPASTHPRLDGLVDVVVVPAPCGCAARTFVSLSAAPFFIASAAYTAMTAGRSRGPVPALSASRRDRVGGEGAAEVGGLVELALLDAQVLGGQRRLVAGRRRSGGGGGMLPPRAEPTGGRMIGRPSLLQVAAG